jgi:CRP/FNR family transcriptional regulator
MDIEQLKKIVFFQTLDDEILNKIVSITVSSRRLKNNIIFYEGDNANKLHFLVSGVIKLYKTTSNDKNIVLKYFQPGELIGELASFENIPYPATAEAFTDIEFLKIDFEKFKELMYINPELSFKIQASLIKKIKNLESIISHDLVLDAKERVAKFIYDNPDMFFKRKNIEIAEILNMTPETYSRILKKFKVENLINLKEKQIDEDGLLKYFI